MMLGRFTGVVGGMQAVSMRHVGVMTCLLVTTALVMFCGFKMVLCRVLVVFRCFPVMLRAFMFHVGDLCVNLPDIAISGEFKYSVLPVSARFRSRKFHVTAAERSTHAL